MRLLPKAGTALGSAAALVTLGLPGATAATIPDPQVAWTGANVAVAPDGSTAYVVGKYRCYGGEEGTHLWVAVKQGPRLTSENTSSAYADAYYDTNWNWEQSEAGLTVDCDGHWHVTRYELRQVFGELEDGTAYVQFCLFDSTGNEENFPQGFAYDYSWKAVRVP